MGKTIFIVDDEPAILKLITHWVKNEWEYNVRTFTNGTDLLESINENPDMVLLDIMLPDISGTELLKRIKRMNKHLPVIMLSAQGNIDVALECIREGAYDYFPKPVDKNRLQPAIKNAIRSFDLERRVDELNTNLQNEYSFDNIVSADKKMQDVFKMVTKVLNNDITVLITGESGTGKELIARAIHYNGTRKDDPFVVVNSASIPRELLESELFGHERGAFTGAHQRKIGKFEMADGGTIFLDEIGDMEMSLQAKILRVIQEKEFERVGGNETIKTDVRIISATNVNLKDAVSKRDFREDLYYRISSFPILIPPLRERRGDVVILINHFLSEFNKKNEKEIKHITKPALKLLYDYEWPGNIRELENTIERCIILADDDKVDVEVLPPQILTADGAASVDMSGPLFTEESPIIPFEKLKAEAIKHALRITNGNIVDASKKLNVGRATLYRLMEKYEIKSKRN
ncbi:MAG: sigma-54 dependent transcriptional regulator [Melioribacteraceae bacterium]